MSEDDYLELISLDFNDGAVRYLVEKIIKKYVSNHDFVLLHLSQMLQRIVDRELDVQRDIHEIYRLYCRGLGFLQKVAMDYGLKVAVPPPDHTRVWDELTEIEQKSIIDGFYPQIIQDAQLVLDCFENRRFDFSQINIYSLIDPPPIRLEHQEYKDLRTKAEKKKMSIKYLNLDNPFVRFIWRWLRISIVTYSIK